MRKAERTQTSGDLKISLVVFGDVNKIGNHVERLGPWSDLIGRDGIYYHQSQKLYQFTDYEK